MNCDIRCLFAAAASLIAVSSGGPAFAAGDAKRGAQVFGQCTA